MPRRAAKDHAPTRPDATVSQRLTARKPDVDRAVLMERYITQDPRRPGPERALIAERGVSVAAVIAYLKSVDWNQTSTARAYELPVAAVEAAIAYYASHEPAIDARIAAQAAFHTA
jgi:uncharacterized protein (DUF433 family)